MRRVPIDSVCFYSDMQYICCVTFYIRGYQNGFNISILMYSGGARGGAGGGGICPPEIKKLHFDRSGENFW